MPLLDKKPDPQKFEAARFNGQCSCLLIAEITNLMTVAVIASNDAMLGTDCWFP